jgi:glycosyltransferase involved in cell wall biosynthesis
VRILHLPSSYMPDTLGGTEVYLQQLVEMLRLHGHDAQVAWHTETGALPHGSIALPPLRAASRVQLYAKSAGREPRGLDELLTTSKPDLIHFHAFTLGAGLDHAHAAERHGIPYLITFHTPTMACARGTWLLDGRGPCDGLLEARRCARCVLTQRGWPPALASALGHSPLSLAFEGPWTPHLAAPALMAKAFDSWRAFFGGAQVVVACADFVAERLARNGVAAERILVSRQALPGPTRQRTLRMPRRRPDRPLRLGFFGRVTPLKGPDLAVESVRQLRARGIHTVLELVGPLETSEASWAREKLFDARPWVRHVGVLRGEALRDWLASIDLVVIPSRSFETGPLTLLEAWDAGVPVVGTDLGGIAEFMNQQGLGGGLFALEDASSIANSVERMLDWPGPDPSVTIRGMDELTSEMLALYERCTAEAPRRSRH